uniref:NAC domain-containing protein n=1 Tax=Triticum urartu TaxID=4572 RepID=A0A8R7RCJ0_TRIUA
MDQQHQEESCVPPGFRFHPIEDELVGYYLAKKVAAQKIDLDIIPKVDLYGIEPWNLEVRPRQGRSASGGGGGAVVVGMVLLQLQGPQVPQRHGHQPRHGGRVLEGHRPRQASDIVEKLRGHRHEEDACVLQGPRPQW